MTMPLPDEITGAAAAGLPADPEFLPALFKAEVGEDSDPFATKLGAYFVVHVNGVTPPKLKPLDQVRAQAIAAWTDEQRSSLLANKARQLTERGTAPPMNFAVVSSLIISAHASRSSRRGGRRIKRDVSIRMSVTGVWATT